MIKFNVNSFLMYLCKNFKLLLYKHTHTHTFSLSYQKWKEKSQKVKDKLLLVLKSEIHWTEVNLCDVFAGKCKGRHI